jgi:hypothetical protein
MLVGTTLFYCRIVSLKPGPKIRLMQQSDSLLAHHLRQNHRSKHTTTCVIPPQQSPGVNSVTIGIKVGLWFFSSIVTTCFKALNFLTSTPASGIKQSAPLYSQHGLR